MTTPRRGGTLVELLVALPLAALVWALLATTLLDSWRSYLRQDANARRPRELHHALAVLAAELRPLTPADVHYWSDTLLAASTPLATGLVCDHPTPTEVLMVPPPGASLQAPWRSLPAPGDPVTGWALEATTQAPMPVRAILQAVDGGPPCALPHAPPQPAWRLRLLLPTVRPLAPGLPLRVTRAVRYRLYASSGTWYLGRQRLIAGAWETIQPVAGPLASPQHGGMTLQAWDAAGAPLAPPGTAPQHLRITLRAPAEPSGHRTPIPPITLGTAVSLRRPAP